MKCWIFAHLKNEANLLPFFLRHYGAFATKIHLYDDGSTDGSRELIEAHPKAVLHDANTKGLDEEALINLARKEYPKAIGKADFCMWVDIDEFIYHPNILRYLTYYDEAGYDVIRPVGFNMIGEGLPVDDGVRQIWEVLRTGVPAPVYSKPVIFRPSLDIAWDLGKHILMTPGLNITPWGNLYQADPLRIRLLHYRFLGETYTRARNARQFSHSTDKARAWTCAPEYAGEHSPAWARKMVANAYDVVCPEASYKLIKGIWPKLPSTSP